MGALDEFLAGEKEVTAKDMGWKGEPKSCA
jgi:hypothetical protein